MRRFLRATFTTFVPVKTEIWCSYDVIQASSQLTVEYLFLFLLLQKSSKKSCTLFLAHEFVAASCETVCTC